ncbi:MAG: D-glycero-alpha-D-manno-heptose-1,7-bisphosphate 7-phosphatase [Myxococcales bacterium]|nr:HAD family hydrolase [Myxococcales bacterium]
MRRAVFLDRDGVLIEEIGHLHRREDVRLIPGAASAVRALSDLGFFLVVVTNQSAVANGLCSEAELGAIHEEIARQLAAGGARVDEWAYCPHHPQAVIERYRKVCECRKPAPGMLLAAKKAHGLDLTRSFLVGDKISDIEAAHRAGAHAILVETGHGAAEKGQRGSPDHVARDLPSAVEWIRSRVGQESP